MPYEGGRCPTEAEWERLLPKYDDREAEVMNFLKHVHSGCHDCYQRWRKYQIDAERALVASISKLYNRHRMN